MVPFKADATTRSKLDYWVAVERSVPGRMHLLPIFDARDTLVDFRCAVATAAVARLLDESSGEATGRRLSDLLTGQDNPGELLRAYVASATSGEAACFTSVSRNAERIRHRLVVSPRFAIQAELRDVSAAAQARAAFDRLKVRSTLR